MKAIPLVNICLVTLFAQSVTAYPADLCCSTLLAILGPSKVFYSTSSEYTRSANTYFAKQQGELQPSCYVKPTCSLDVSKVIGSLALLNSKSNVCPFAVKGGGHHTVIGISNINNGVTIDLGNMNQTTWNAAKTIGYVEAGARWGAVYEELGKISRGAAGGRVADIGVGGYLTGGGISYFGAAYGFGCDTVVNFEVVLASGRIVNANAKENTKLFEALKGGSNNLGVVTRFDLKIFPLANYWGGSNLYLGSQTPALLDAFNSFTLNPNFDTKAALIVTPIYTSAVGYLTNVNFAYTEAIVNPPIFSNITTKSTPIITGTKISNLTDFATVLGTNSSNNLRETSITATVKPNLPLLLSIFNLWNATVPLVQSAENLQYSMTYQPLPINMLNIGPKAGGNVLGLTSAQGPLVVLTLTVQYTSPSSDALVLSTTRTLFSNIRTLAAKTNDLIPWIYLNYADKTQDVIPTYGTQNVAKLRAVSADVDPKKFFQKVQPGGYKLW